MKRRERQSAAGNVPHVCHNHAARSHHACHFGDGLGGIGNERDHQRHGRSVEGAVGERKLLCVALLELSELRSRPRPRIGELFF
jgi:hypothetical protein